MTSITVADVADMLADFGRPVVLRRPGSPNVDVTLQAHVVGYSPDELVGGISQGDRKVTIGAAEIVAASWPLPIRSKSDQIIIDGKTYTVQGPDPRYAGPTNVMHVLTVRGN